MAGGGCWWRADSFEKMDKIGQGTYSNVYRDRNLDQGKIVALKKVRFENLEPESVRFTAREIHILRKLDHPNVTKLEGLVSSRMSCSFFEYIEHDLAGLSSHPSLKFTESQFFTTKPFPCDPSSLPSKEFDANIRDEEARRQATAGGKVHRPGPERRGTRESPAIPAPEANAELVSSLQKRQGQSYSRSEKFNPQHEESASGFPINPPRPSQAMEEVKTNTLHKRASHSCPLVQRDAWSKAGEKTVKRS